MRRAVHSLLTPRMIAVHLAAAALIVAMALLGRWQLDVSNAKHFYWQNLIYAIQWWIFCGFTLFGWGRIMRDALRRPPDEDGAGTSLIVVSKARRPVAPGPALLVDETGSDIALDVGHHDTRLATPTVYRGYVMPNSAVDRDRSTEDRYRAAYDDQLWQLALADAAAGHGPRPTVPRGTIEVDDLARRLDIASGSEIDGGDDRTVALPFGGAADAVSERHADDRRADEEEVSGRDDDGGRAGG